jgi:hypothetical protein
MKIKNLFLMIAVSIFLGSCKDSSKPIIVSAGDEPLQGTLIAEPVIYDMVIKNANPDDEWAEECLMNLDREKLVNFVFDAVYSEQLTPYDYFTDEPIKLSDLKALEKEFAREIVGKLQFEEEWSFDEASLQLRKKVNKLLLAYELYNSAGEIRGYKPAFYVMLN